MKDQPKTMLRWRGGFWARAEQEDSRARPVDRELFERAYISPACGIPIPPVAPTGGCPGPPYTKAQSRCEEAFFPRISFCRSPAAVPRLCCRGYSGLMALAAPRGGPTEWRAPWRGNPFHLAPSRSAGAGAKTSALSLSQTSAPAKGFTTLPLAGGPPPIAPCTLVPAVGSSYGGWHPEFVQWWRGAVRAAAERAGPRAASHQGRLSRTVGFLSVTSCTPQRTPHVRAASLRASEFGQGRWLVEVGLALSPLWLWTYGFGYGYGLRV